MDETEPPHRVLIGGTETGWLRRASAEVPLLTERDLLVELVTHTRVLTQATIGLLCGTRSPTQNLT